MKAVQAHLSPISCPFWIRVGARVKARGWVGATPVP